MNELIDRLRNLNGERWLTAVTPDMLCREAADTLLALQTQLERVERETIERCANEAQKWNYGIGMNNRDRAACAQEVADRIRALPAQTEQQKG